MFRSLMLITGISVLPLAACSILFNALSEAIEAEVKLQRVRDRLNADAEHMNRLLKTL